MKLLLFFLFIILSSFEATNSIAKNSKNIIEDELCLHGCPYKTESKSINIIVDHSLFILSQNKVTKFADWVAYKVTPENINADIKAKRYWRVDPKLPEEYVLIPSDYKRLHTKCNYDRGHEAPLASFKVADFHKTNYTSNITPQKADLNRGSWLKLETKVRELVNKKNKPLYIITGTYYKEGDELCGLERTRINYKIPSGYWKILAIEEDGKLKVASFAFPQNAKRKDALCSYKSNLEAIENISGLEFFEKKLNDVDSNSLMREIGCI